jgi:type IV pilus assembly protein PilY1
MVTPNGSDIGNSLPSSAVVITPDTAYNIPWRGAMVYFNDLEGKITKINLTSSTENSAELFDQTTLFRLNANTDNRRYSYFSMDAGIGLTTRDFWLFGGTGNFGNIGGGSKFMDNILYGIKDPHYPYFKHLNAVHVPPETDTTFIKTAHEGANAAKSVEDGVVCVNTTGKVTCDYGPGPGDLAWVIHLDTPDGLAPNNPSTVNTYRKLSAPPTLFKGQVYFPIYEPPPGTDACNIGMAYICVADDECGSNNSHLLTRGGVANSNKCKQVREGILSELIIFGDTLFANVAGPKDDEETLYQVLAAAGEVKSSRGSWRESGF